MIERLAKMRRAAAGAHVESMRDKASVECRVRHAADVPRIARPFEAMHQHDFPQRLAEGPLRLHKNLGVFLSPYETIFQRIRRLIVIARPEIAEDGEDVRIAEKRLKRPHAARPSIFAERRVRCAGGSRLGLHDLGIFANRSHLRRAIFAV